MAGEGKGRLHALAGALLSKIEDGGTLAEALGSLETPVPAGHAALIDAGESSGCLDETLAAIVAEEKILTEARRRLLQGLAYPLLICCLAFLLPFLYLVFQGRTGEYLLVQSYFFVPLALLFLALYYRRKIFPPGSSRRGLAEQVLLALPLVGGLVRQYALAGVLQLLGRLLQAGLGFSDGLPLVMKAAGLRGLSRQVEEMAARIAGGSSASEGLQCIEGIPADLRSRLASGDVSGTSMRLSSNLERSSGTRHLPACKPWSRSCRSWPTCSPAGLCCGGHCRSFQVPSGRSDGLWEKEASSPRCPGCCHPAGDLLHGKLP